MSIFNPNIQEMMRKLQENPGEFMKSAGVNVPQEMLGDPKAMVMHLIQTGQVSSPMLQRIMPMIRQMGGK